MIYQSHQCCARSIANTREHGFPKECSAQGDSIKTTNQLLSFPGLDGVSEAKVMQSTVALQDRVVDPGRFTIRTPYHDITKARIEPDLEGRFLKESFQTMGNMERVEREDSPGIWREPSNFSVVHAHRKETLSIGLEKECRFNDRGVDLFSFVS